MKKQIFLTFLCVFTIQVCFPNGIEPVDDDGDGKLEVSTLEHLLWISANDTAWDYDYEQMADIDASITQYWDDSDDNTDGILYNDPNDSTETGNNEGWLAIGNASTSFTGSYHGQGYTITGLTIQRSTNIQGLFGQVDGVSIDNLGIIDGSVSGSNYTGGLVGASYNSTITDCYTSGNVNGVSEVGGLLGRSYNTAISNCYTSGNIGGESRIGGLVGYSRDGSSISKCYSTGNVFSSIFNAGGLVGYNSESSIDSCYALGNVNGNRYVGGLAGDLQSATLSKSYAKGSVSGIQEVGGLVGYQWQANIAFSYATGDVNGSGNSVGGLTGRTYGVGSISNSYATGNVTRTAGNDTIFGAFLGYGHPSTSVSYCYSTGSVFYDGADNPTKNGFTGMDEGTVYLHNLWDCQTSNQFSAIGASPVRTLEMKIQTTFLLSGWDFAGESANGILDIWSIASDGQASYPYLTENMPDTLPGLVTIEFAGGDGTPGDPFQVQTLTHLNQIRFNLDASYVQIADIDASATASWDDGNGGDPEGWVAIGHHDYRFTGTYNGQNHVISGLTSLRPGTDYQGLFGYTDNSSIDSLGLEGMNISGDYYVGGITGRTNNGNTINACYATGIADGRQEVGALVGWNENSLISECYADATVSGTRTNIGVLVGGNYNAKISNCYALGNVTRTQDTFMHFGVFVGVNNDTIEYSYAIGSVFYDNDTDPTDKGFIGANSNDYYRDNFWDSEASNQSTGIGATGNTTATMKTQSTYTAANWDFMVETANGTSDIWGINTTDNNGYPFLRWQGYKLETEVTAWPSAGNINCGQTLADAVLTGGTASVGGSFAFAEPDLSPAFGTNDYTMVFTPTDQDNYAIVTGMVSVTVEDNVDPEITSTHNDKSLDADENCEAILPDYRVDVVANDLCDTAIVITQTPDPGTVISGATNTVTLRVTDEAGNYTEVSFNVAVEDNTNPEITSTHNDQSVNADSNCEAVLPDYTGDVIASDNCDMDLTITQTPLAGTTITGTSNTVTITVTDDAGNSAERSFNVEVIDITDPSVTCVDNQEVDATNAGVYVVSGTEFDPTSVNDNCSLVSIENDFNSLSGLDGAEIPAGTTVVVWTATDAEGNTATCQTEITVNPVSAIRMPATEGLRLFPNPAGDKIHVEFPDEYVTGEEIQIRITDYSGKLCMQSGMADVANNLTIELSHLEHGMYSIQIYSEKRVYTGTFVKQ